MPWVTKSSGENYQPDSSERVYTKAELRKNWWHYHWMLVVGVVAAAIAAFFVIKDTVFQPKPDYQIAWVGSYELPIDTGDALVAAFEELCDDRNGDGQVLVQLNQYTVDLDPESDNTDAYSQMAGVTRLSADLSSRDSYIFLLEDPEAFQKQTGALQYLDGTTPEDGAEDWENMCLLWADCPVLTALELGEYQGFTVLDDKTGQNQDLLAGVYVTRRALLKESDGETFAADEALWQRITAQ